MAYKVNYYTLALMEGGKVGNIKQSTGHVFTNEDIANIPAVLNGYLKQKDRVGVIEKIEEVGGACI